MHTTDSRYQKRIEMVVTVQEVKPRLIECPHCGVELRIPRCWTVWDCRCGQKMWDRDAFA